jgi:Lhr-like helicase
MSCTPSSAPSAASSLQALMHRIERVIGRRVPRIGLSATLGDMGLAADFCGLDMGLPWRWSSRSRRAANCASWSRV